MTFWRELRWEPRIAGLIGLLLFVMSMIVRGTYPVAGEIISWSAWGLIMTAAIIQLRQKYGQKDRK
jgi:hypothetical protein